MPRPPMLCFRHRIPQRVAAFVERALWQANHTRGAHVLFTMGSDYQYEDAEEWYVNLDKLVKYVNERSGATGVRAQYSTMDTYVAEAHTAPMAKCALSTRLH